MPLYDFRCPHGHEFEHQCKIAEREEKISCEGTVNQLVADEVYDEYSAGDGKELPDGLSWTEVEGGKVLVKKVPCQLKAEIFIGVHNNPGGALDHGLGSNRDAAREGRYDPLKPNTRFMAKGRGWRK